MKEFFGFGGYQREAEGFFSWQHLTFVTFFVVLTLGLAVYLGLKNKNKSYEAIELPTRISVVFHSPKDLKDYTYI